MTQPEHARGVFLTGVKNARAMERQALSIMQPELDRWPHHPDLSRRLEAHMSETEAQLDRLDRIQDSLGKRRSTMKDSFLSAVGSMAALGHVTAGDEVLKNSFANLAFENYEDKERQMADWAAEHIPSVTETFISLQGNGETAKL